MLRLVTGSDCLDNCEADLCIVEHLSYPYKYIDFERSRTNPVKANKVEQGQEGQKEHVVVEFCQRSNQIANSAVVKRLLKIKGVGLFWRKGNPQSVHFHQHRPWIATQSQSLLFVGTSSITIKSPVFEQSLRLQIFVDTSQISCRNVGIKSFRKHCSFSFQEGTRFWRSSTL